MAERGYAVQRAPDDVAGVVLGSGVKDLAAQAGRFGAAKVFVADDPALEAPLASPQSPTGDERADIDTTAAPAGTGSQATHAWPSPNE